MKASGSPGRPLWVAALRPGGGAVVLYPSSRLPEALATRAMLRWYGRRRAGRGARTVRGHARIHARRNTTATGSVYGGPPPLVAEAVMASFTQRGVLAKCMSICTRCSLMPASASEAAATRHDVGAADAADVASWSVRPRPKRCFTLFTESEISALIPFGRGGGTL